MTKQVNKFHFIAIGGSVMHNLAIALHEKGHHVSGSDDEIYEPAKGRLLSHGILPEKTGWHPEKINTDIDAVILGMHAKKDNPELFRAQELGIAVYSYPEFVFQQSADKKRVVIAGSHGKTSITSMIMHVLRYNRVDFDYMLGAALKGFEHNVKLTDAPLIIIEGDEYMSSPIDLKPKFLHYQHHLGLISGIFWDHINVYPDEQDYNDQFEKFASLTQPGGSLIYCTEDEKVKEIGEKNRPGVSSIPYQKHPYLVNEGIYYLKTMDAELPLRIFGAHNMQNLAAARAVVEQLGITDNQFYKAIADFEGAAKRLELVEEANGHAVFKDFAHAPSKVKASIDAAKERNKNRKLIAIVELHTFSSLHPDFISNYKNTGRAADSLFVFINPENLKLEDTSHLTEYALRNAFDRQDLRCFTNINQLCQMVNEEKDASGTNFLWMSSGNFAQTDFEKLSKELLK